MTLHGWLQIALFFLVILVATRPLGAYMARVFERQRTFADPFLRPIERWIYRVCGVREDDDMRWTRYTGALLLFSAASLLLTYGIERTQAWLPLNPEKLANVPAILSWNTAVSFTTNTNWQAYSGETTMSYLSQMFGLAFHNFVSAAVGIAACIAIIRGLARRNAKGIGNFWVDLTRSLLWVLLPMAVLGALLLVSQGVIQNFHPSVHATTVEGARQIIPQGPVASQEAIKELGTNGGGFFNANSAHPYENPTPFSNFLEMCFIFLIPASLTYTLGRMVGNQRHGWAVFAAMAILFFAGVTTAYANEARGNPMLARLGVDQHASALQPGGNMEGKELRFGVANSALFATVTTDTSCGAVNSFHDSFTPLGGMVPLLDIMSGEVIFGGVGSGLYGMILFIVLAVFIAGLMVGRTPELLGKKIEAKEVKMAMLAILVVEFSILGFSGLAAVSHTAQSSILNPGPHGLTEMVYAYSSAAGNNGSAFAGLNANTNYWNLTTALAMIFGRFFMKVPLLAMAGSLAAKKHVPPSHGTFPVDGPLFVGLLIGVVVIVGALTFLPALALGPVLEHFLMLAGRTF